VVNWQNLQRKPFIDKHFEKKKTAQKRGNIFRIQMELLVPAPEKLLKPRCFKELFLCMDTGH
jgi:hypothetical protein